MKNLKYITALLISSLLISCTDIVQLDIPEGPKLIIVNGRITDSIPVWVDVLVSAPIFEAGANPKVDSASVLLFENGINVSTLAQDSIGIYRSPFVGTIGNSYYVQVIVPASDPNLAGTAWESKVELMEATAPIDSIYQETLPDNPPFQDAGEYVFYNFTDIAGVPNNYRIVTWKNDTLNSGGGSITVFDDEFFDGRTFTNDKSVVNRLPAIQVNGGPAKNLEKWNVEHSSISKDYMNYLILVQQQTSQTGGLFDPPPALLAGNIIGITNPEKSALGFFAASAIKTVEYTVVF